MKILDLGSGNNKLPGAVGIDVRKTTQVDIVHNLNEFPYPFSDNEFDFIRCNNILEHLDDLVAVFKELYRISKPDAEIYITVPFFSSVDSFTDLTHHHFFTYRSLDNLLDYDYGFRFAIQKRKIQFGLYDELLFGIEFFANAFPKIYERCFAYLFPAQSILFILKTKK